MNGRGYTMENKSLDTIFLHIKEILANYSENLVVADAYIGSKAKTKKPAYHLYGSKEVSLFGKKPQKTYVAGVIQQKNYVSFYLSAIYSHPELLQHVSPELRKHLKGKSCFNLAKAGSHIYEEINKMLEIGIAKYKDIEWI
ncbi:MAG: hypothetical protein NWE80_00935 [Candidatus Bathyarchaeota archaeon]|nr:hypothetical protein [Candidatus Bathyarchaeota archaeon]